MTKSHLLICLSIYGIWLITACSDAPKSLNPNGDSELAIVMRELFEDGLQMKQAIERGEIPNPKVDHKRILSAHATEPEKVASETYENFASAYLDLLASFKTANKEEATALYEGMVNTCMNCHRALCPGPMVKIKKLY